ncbi:hypothetical protein [Pseudoduganella violaceinigra]|uniref:hypothetical protein n=1 Tax=Pseudoduganella violaceinigra TaxID=246602 RepID=UPI00041925F5|nr:hypothetical protein [Pseudoduganella violaceinigra]
MRSLVTILLAALCGFAAAPAGAHDFGPYLQAGLRLQVMPTLPRLKDPEGAALLTVLGDNGRFLDREPFGQDDMNTLMDVCGVANRINVAYLLHDLQKSVAGVDKNDAQAVARAMQSAAMNNVLEYQDEIALVMPFSLRCQARIAPLMVTFLRDLPPEQLTDIRKGGVRQAQNGSYSSYVGYLSTITGDGIKEANLRRFSAAMADSAPAFASILPLPMRRQLRDLATATKARAPAALADDLSKVIEAMDSESCSAMCAMR